jgi:ADP-ribose pyrophosphatase
MVAKVNVQIKKPRPAKSTSKVKSPKPALKKAGSNKASAGSTLVSSKVTFKGRVFDVHTDTVREPNGLILQRDVIRHIGSVVILAIDESRNAKDPDVVIERQYRHAVGDFLLELPAGRIEPNESSLAAAKREMIEETGYRAKKWSLLTKYYPSPGFLGESMKIYLARDIRPGLAQPEADEQIEILRMPLSAVMALIKANKIHDGKTLIGLLLLDSTLRKGRL